MNKYAKRIESQKLRRERNIMEILSDTGGPRSRRSTTTQYGGVEWPARVVFGYANLICWG